MKATLTKLLVAGSMCVASTMASAASTSSVVGASAANACQAGPGGCVLPVVDPVAAAPGGVSDIAPGTVAAGGGVAGIGGLSVIALLGILAAVGAILLAVRGNGRRPVSPS